MAGQKTIKSITVEIDGKAQKLGQAINGLDSQSKKLNTTVYNLKKNFNLDAQAVNTDKFRRAQAAAAEQLTVVNQKAQLLKNTMAGLQKEGLDKSNNAELYKDLQNELVKVENQAKKVEKQIQELNSIKLDAIINKVNSIGSSFETIGRKMLPVTAAIAAGVGAATKAAINYEDAFASVRKTVDGTEAELQAINDGIREMANETPIAATEIAGIAANAGQLGIATENVLGFSKVMADLGVTTNLSGEAAASTFARFANITGMSQQHFDRLGAAIVYLGNNLATTEAEIADMALNLAAAGSQAGMSEASILGIAGALSSVGVEAQAGGTAFSKVINRMTVDVQTGNKELGEFARIAGMSAKEFADAYNKDAAGALIAFIQGLGDIDRHGSSAVVLLEELGLTEVRLRDALTRAANANELFTDSMINANKAWQENAALVDEANIRYQTTASQIQIAKNNLNDAAITLGQEFLPYVIKATDGIKNLSEWFKNLDDGQKNFYIKLLAITAAIGPVSLGLGKLLKTGAALITGVKGATSAFQVFNTVLKANPAILVATGLMALVTAGIALGNAVNKTTIDVEKLNKSLDDLQSAQDKKALISEYKELSDAVRDGMLSTEELVIAQARIAELEKQIVDMSGDYITAEDVKNGKIRERIGLLEKEASFLESQAQMDFQTGMAEGAETYNQARANIEALEQEQVARMNASNALREYAVQIQQLDAEMQVVRDNAALSEQEQSAQLKTLASERAAAIAQMEAQYGIIGVTVADINNGIQANADAFRDNMVALQENGTAVEEYISILESGVQRGYTTWAEANDELNLGLSETEVAIMDAENAWAAAEQRLQDVSNAQSVSAATLKELEDEYYNTIALNEDLIGMYPELVAAIESADTAEERAVAIAQATAAFRKQLKADEVQAQYDAIQTEIKNLNIFKDAAAIAYAAIGKMGIMAVSMKMAEATGAGIDAAIADAEARAASLEARIKDLSAPVASGAGLSSSIGGGSGKGGSGKGSSSKKDPELEAYKKRVESLKYMRDMDEIDEAEYYRRLEELRDEHLTKDSEEWQKATVELYKWKKQHQQDEYNELRDDLKYLLDLDIITQKEYYAQLAELRDKYLEENSAEWRKVTVEIHNYQKDIYEKTLKEQEEAQKKAQSKALESFNNWAKNYITQLEKVQKAEQARLQALIDGIDEEIKKRRELREDEANEDAVAAARKRLEAAKTQLAFSRDEFEIAELQKEVARREQELADALQAQDDTLWYRAQEAEKERLQSAIDASKEYLDAQKELVDSMADNYGSQISSGDADSLSYLVGNAQSKISSALDSLKQQQQKAAALMAQTNQQASGSGGVVNNANVINNNVNLEMTTNELPTVGVIKLAVNKALEEAGK